jgi:hypothetical protein
MDTVSSFQSALYILNHDFKLGFQYHNTIKMCSVFEILTFYGIFLFHETMKQAKWVAIFP